MVLTTHHLLAPALRLSRAIPQFILCTYCVKLQGDLYPNFEKSPIRCSCKWIALKAGYVPEQKSVPSNSVSLPSSPYKDVSKSSRTVLVKRSLFTLDVKFLHHLQSTPFLHEYSSPSVSAMLGSIPGSPFFDLCQVPAAIPLESLQWCRIFDPSSEASAWGRAKRHRVPDWVNMGDGG